MQSNQAVTMSQLMSVPLHQRPWIAVEILRAAHGARDAMPLDAMCAILTTTEGKASTDAIASQLNDAARRVNMDAMGGGPLRYRITKTWAGTMLARGNRTVRPRISLSAKRPPKWITKHQAWPMHLENLHQVLTSYLSGAPLYPDANDTKLLDAAWMQLVGVSPQMSAMQSCVAQDFIAALHDAPYTPSRQARALTHIAWGLRERATRLDHIKVNPTSRSTEPAVWAGYGERQLLVVIGGNDFISVYNHDDSVHAIHFPVDPLWIDATTSSACSLCLGNLAKLKRKQL